MRFTRLNLLRPFGPFSKKNLGNRKSEEGPQIATQGRGREEGAMCGRKRSTEEKEEDAGGAKKIPFSPHKETHMTPEGDRPRICSRAGGKA